MTIAELIAVLQRLDPEASVVVADDQELERGHIIELRAEYVRLCAIHYTHPDRAPKFANDGRPANAVFIGARMTPAQESLLTAIADSKQFTLAATTARAAGAVRLRSMHDTLDAADLAMNSTLEPKDAEKNKT